MRTLVCARLQRTLWFSKSAPEVLRVNFVSLTQTCQPRSSGGAAGSASKTESQPELSKRQWTEKENEIIRLHGEACGAKEQTYTDPATGYKVFTQFAHLQRGKCCGSACRHCPYGQVNVKDPLRRTPFNSAFYA